MSTYTATVTWERGDARFTDNRYPRAHRWYFDGDVEVPASASPHVVPVPMSDPHAVDPEEAFVAALAACHMLFFLSIAAKRQLVVDRYDDEAAGVLEKDEHGRLAMTRVVLRPRVRYVGERPDAATEAALHHEAHERCFLANSVRGEIVVETPPAP